MATQCKLRGAGKLILLDAKPRKPIGIKSSCLCRSTSLFQQKLVQINKQLHLRDMGHKMKPMQVVASSKSDDQKDIIVNLTSPSDTIKQFYAAINKKSSEEIKGLLSDDCFYEDLSFPVVFHGKKETVHFLEYLITSMGEHIEVNVECILEGGGHVAAVNWHLEWKKNRVPLTRGSSYFEFSRIEDRLLIKKVRVMFEPPIKPGSFGLAHFSIVTSLFDAFPEATEAILRKPHFLIQLLLKGYVTGCKHIVDPALAFYIKLLNFAARFITVLFKFLHYIFQMLLERRGSDNE